jgi:hypothetical protein
MVSCAGVMKGFVANGSDSMATVLADEDVIDPAFIAEISARSRHVNEVALETDLLEKGIVVLDVLIKVAHQNDIVTTSLMELDKGNKIMAEIVTRVQIRMFHFEKGRLLFMICCCAGPIRGLGANLIGHNKKVGAALCAGGGTVGPVTIFVAIGKRNAPCAIALCNYGGVAGFIIRDSLVLTTAKLKSNRVPDLLSGGIKCLPNMVLGHIAFMFDYAL